MPGVNMIEAGYVLGTALIVMILVMRGYPMVRRLRAEGKLSVRRARRAATQGSNL